MPVSHATRAGALQDLCRRASACTRCRELTRSRTQVVFGSGPVDARLMLVAEAPGAGEDREGDPLVGEAGALLDALLAGIGLSRAQVAITSLVRCRPPANRAPLRSEIEACREYLDAQLALVQPVLVCPLGHAATRLLRGDTTPIRRVRGTEEVRVVGPRAVWLYPLLHPAAALYTPEDTELLRADVARIPALLARGVPAQPVVEVEVEPAPRPGTPVVEEPPPAPEDPQLGLF